MLSFEYSLFFSVMNINKWRCFSSLKTSSSKRVHLHTVLLYRISPVQKRIHLLTGTISIIPQCPFLKKALCATWHTLCCVCCVILGSYLECRMAFLSIYLFIYLQSFQIPPKSRQILAILPESRHGHFCGNFYDVQFIGMSFEMGFNQI